jgi:hypothetical protein
MASWTSPKTWSAGSPVTAAELNTHLRDNLTYLYDRDVGLSPTKSADQTRNSAVFTDITDLTFSVTAGKNYTIIAVITWTHDNVGGGPIISFNHPGGTARLLVEHTGETSSTSSLREWITTNDGGSGVATVDTINVARITTGFGRYTCSSSGTFAMRVARNTTGTTTIQAGASLFVTSD